MQVPDELLGFDEQLGQKVLVSSIIQQDMVSSSGNAIADAVLSRMMQIQAESNAISATTYFD